MKIVEYTVVSMDNVNQAKQAINDRISEGWQPFGSIQTCVDSEGKTRFTQALVKYE